MVYHIKRRYSRRVPPFCEQTLQTDYLQLLLLLFELLLLLFELLLLLLLLELLLLLD